MGDHREKELEKLARATEDLDVADGFTDRVMSAVGGDARTLDRVAALTESLAPREGFADSVMQAVRAEASSRVVSSGRAVLSGRGGWFDGVGRSGIRAVFVAAAVAAACVVYSSYTERSFDMHLADVSTDEAGE
jgi:hypothetical protein